MILSLTFGLVVDIVQWVLFAVALALSVLRYYIRRTNQGKLLIDDWIHLAALIQLSYCAISSPFTSFQFVDTLTGDDTDSLLRSLWPFEQIFNVVYWTTLYTCKAVFLALYWQIFRVSHRFIFWWWVVVGITFAGFVVNVIQVFTGCSIYLKDYGYETCTYGTQTDAETSYIVKRGYAMGVAPNVLTDLLIMMLPIAMLYDLHLKASRKAKLVPIFLLGFITIGVDITGWTLTYIIAPGSARTAAGFAGRLLVAIEDDIAVIVAALPAVLFVRQKGRNDSSAQPLINKGHSSPEPSSQGTREKMPVVSSGSHPPTLQPMGRLDLELGTGENEVLVHEQRSSTGL